MGSGATAPESIWLEDLWINMDAPEVETPCISKLCCGTSPQSCAVRKLFDLCEKKGTNKCIVKRHGFWGPASLPRFCQRKRQASAKPCSRPCHVVRADSESLARTEEAVKHEKHECCAFFALAFQKRAGHSQENEWAEGWRPPGQLGPAPSIEISPGPRKTSPLVHEVLEPGDRVSRESHRLSFFPSHFQKQNKLLVQRFQCSPNGANKKQSDALKESDRIFIFCQTLPANDLVPKRPHLCPLCSSLCMRLPPPHHTVLRRHHLGTHLRGPNFRRFLPGMGSLDLNLLEGRSAGFFAERT